MDLYRNIISVSIGNIGPFSDIPITYWLYRKTDKNEIIRYMVYQKVLHIPDFNEGNVSLVLTYWRHDFKISPPSEGLNNGATALVIMTLLITTVVIKTLVIIRRYS